MKRKDSKISLFWPTYHGKEIQLAMASLFPHDMSNRWLGQAHKVEEFERAFNEKFDYQYSLAVNSGSAALNLAYHLIGIGPGDEVITPVLTCTATNIPFLHRGAKIVLVDIKDDLTIDPEDVKRKITPKTKVIVVVTLGGLPVDKEVFYIAKKHKIPVVIDAAQSLGVGEKRGDYICYSFQAIKHFTTGDGGMLVLRGKDDYIRGKKLRWFGIDREAKARAAWQACQRRQMTMDIEEPGYKFHMNDIAASIGLIGLKHSDEYLAHRKNIADYYTRNLKCKTISGGSYWLYGVLVENRDEVAEKLKNAGIETNLAHLRNDIFKAFGGQRLFLPNMDRLEPLYLYIPIHTNMTLKDAERVVKTLNSIL
jgi:dTDP-4-amino-4,6-dideoxygalactose transaminase